MECEHPNKVATDGFNYDMEVYWDCPDCGAGWRAEPKTEEELAIAIKISAERDALDKSMIFQE